MTNGFLEVRKIRFLCHEKSQFQIQPKEPFFSRSSATIYSSLCHSFSFALADPHPLAWQYFSSSILQEHSTPCDSRKYHKSYRFEPSSSPFLLSFLFLSHTYFSRGRRFIWMIQTLRFARSAPSVYKIVGALNSAGAISFLKPIALSCVPTRPYPFFSNILSRRQPLPTIL